MDIRDYEFDALPYIDKDYEDPHIRAAVQSIIVAEMRKFTPRDYLANYPLPQLRFESPLLKVEPLFLNEIRSTLITNDITFVTILVLHSFLVL